MRIDPRFYDMDAFGHINNARYLTYFEEARIKYVDDVIGWKYGYAETGIIMARAEIDFQLPAHFKDSLIIYTRCSKIGTKSFTLEYKLMRMGETIEELVANAVTVIVMYNYSEGASIPIPEAWKNAIRQYEGAGLDQP
jgi:acyl-CoA thioester hydrolase